MPRKKTETPADSGAEQEQPQAPKRRRAPVRRKKEPAGAGKVDAAHVDHHAEAQSAQEPRIAEPKVIVPHMPVSESESRADFLAPEKFSFGLKKESAEKKVKSSRMRTFIYTLSGLIIFLAVILLLLTIYSAKLLNAPISGTQNNDNIPAMGQQASGQLKMQISSTSASINKYVQAQIEQKFPKQFTFDTTSAAQSATVDTLFVKKSADQAKLTDLINFLGKIGLAPKIQNNDDMSNDVSLVLAIPTKDLSLVGLTSAVYNASGVTGAAKKYCDALRTYKVASCNALNSPSNSNGFSVYTNSPTALIDLSRTTEFSKATFYAAQTGQVEDIRVVIGK